MNSTVCATYRLLLYLRAMKESDFFKWAGMLILPLGAVIGIILIGFVAAHMGDTRHPEEYYTTADTLAIWIADVMAGVAFAEITFRLAPRKKLLSTIVMSVLLIVFLLYCSIAAYERFGLSCTINSIVLSIGLVATNCEKIAKRHKEKDV